MDSWRSSSRASWEVALPFGLYWALWRKDPYPLCSILQARTCVPENIVDKNKFPKGTGTNTSNPKMERSPGIHTSDSWCSHLLMSLPPLSLVLCFCWDLCLYTPNTSPFHLVLEALKFVGWIYLVLFWGASVFGSFHLSRALFVVRWNREVRIVATRRNKLRTQV